MGRAQEVKFTAVPYYASDNREPGEMVVWIPENAARAEVAQQNSDMSTSES